MKTIKFRGKNFYNNEIIYGDLTQHNEKIFIDGILVNPETVAQFLGYDINGDEVYEGEELINIANRDTIVHAFFDIFPEQDSEIYPDTFTKYVLNKSTVNEDEN